MSSKVHHVGNLNGWDVVVWYEKRPNKNYSSASRDNHSASASSLARLPNSNGTG